jgi:hypothetical protein
MKPGLGIDVLIDRVEEHVVKKAQHHAASPKRGEGT